MQRILVTELAEHIGERATVMGWLHRRRELGQITFLVVRDRSGLGQVVLTDPAHAARASGLLAETVLFIADHRDVMAVARDALAGMVQAVLARAQPAVRALEVAVPEVPPSIPAIHFANAQRLIARDTGESLEDQYDLAPAHERWLGDWARREHGSEYVEDGRAAFGQK